MLDKKYQIFISSTYKDLITARKKVSDEITKMGHFPVGMELFSASDDSQWTVIQRTIDYSDYYVLIIGHRYGTQSEEGISYTEKEYNYALEKGIPVISFIMDRDASTKPSERDEDPDLKSKLENFRNKASDNRVREEWKSESELVQQVTTALYKSFSTHKRSGWIRADDAISPETLNELSILSKENRELRTDIDRLSQQIQDRKVELEVEINSGNPIELFFKDCSRKLLPAPKQWKMSDIPEELIKYTSKEDIDFYNEQYDDTQEKVVEYNEKSKEYYYITHLGLPVEFSVTNKGKIKANDIHVEMTFPDEITVVEGIKDDYILPSRKNIPKNPMKKAEEIYNEENNPFKDLYSLHRTIGDLMQPFAFGDLTRSRLGVDIYKSFNQNHWTRLKQNTIKLYRNDLLQTRVLSYDDKYIIYPHKAGEFEVLVSIICEEYSETYEYTVPIIVNENMNISFDDY